MSAHDKIIQILSILAVLTAEIARVEVIWWLLTLRIPSIVNRSIYVERIGNCKAFDFRRTVIGRFEC